MKIKAIAAAGALGARDGRRRLDRRRHRVGPDECGHDCGAGPIGITPGNIVCNIQSNGSSFAMSVSPGYNLGVLLFGTDGRSPAVWACWTSPRRS